MLTWQFIFVLNIKGKHNFKQFYYIHILEIPTQKGEHSWTCTELSFKRKEGIYLNNVFKYIVVHYQSPM